MTQINPYSMAQSFAARMAARVAVPTAALALCTSSALAADPFVDAVTSFTVGTNGGGGSASLPGIVMGPPRGAGQTQGSLDVVSLGGGGSITLRFDIPVICDGAGDDLTVFENAFHSGSASGPLFDELGVVSVSQDGVNFIQFPYDGSTHVGLAGRTPVLSNPSNGIDPLDPVVSGGDQFDLASVGLTWAAYVRITDVNGSIADLGDLPQFAVAPNAGFDLDAVAALHACDPAQQSTPTPTFTALPPSPTATGKATSTASATPTPSTTATATALVENSPTPTATAAASHDAAVTGRPRLRLRIRDGKTSVSRRVGIRVRNADVSGDTPIQLTLGDCPLVTASVDFDRRAAGAQNSAVIAARKRRSAVVTLVANSADVTTPSGQPSTCTLTLTVAAQVPGNVDPTPTDNSATIELLLVDNNDF